MRLITTLLLAVLLVLGIWSFIAYEPFLLGPSPDGYVWWWPKEISTFGQDIDGLVRRKLGDDLPQGPG